MEAVKYPCPVCELVEAETQEVAQEYGDAPMYQVACMECCTAGPLEETPELALDFWNRIVLED